MSLQVISYYFMLCLLFSTLFSTIQTHLNHLLNLFLAECPFLVCDGKSTGLSSGFFDGRDSPCEAGNCDRTNNAVEVPSIVQCNQCFWPLVSSLLSMFATLGKWWSDMKCVRTQKLRNWKKGHLHQGTGCHLPRPWWSIYRRPSKFFTWYARLCHYLNL